MSPHKAIVAAVPAVLVILNMILTKQPGQIIDWRTMVDAAIGPLLVYMVPNIPKSVLTQAESDAVAVLTNTLGPGTTTSSSGDPVILANPQITRTS